MRNHRKLLIWQKAQQLAVDIRRATRRFPRAGYGRLRSQLVDAAESTVLTIVEGCGSASQKEFARFLDMSTKSQTEVEGALELARDYGVMSRDLWKSLSERVAELRRTTCGLRAKILQDGARKDPNARP